MSDSTDSKRSASLAILVAMTVLTLILWNMPFARIILTPLNIFVTTLHELGHAIFCLFTGGSVIGMTVVSDGHGHAGLTLCRGGMPWIWTQTGYLGTALFGSIFIVLGSKQERCKSLLMGLGALIGVSTLWFMLGAVFSHDALQGIYSVFWGLLSASALIYAGVKLGPTTRQFVVAFLSVITALDAVTSVIGLVLHSVGLSGTSDSFSDATIMAEMTGVPAVLWSLFWGAVSVGMLYGAVRWTYLRKAK
ncbi:MAG: M50 family metallopeptidase [Candidatus Melainabacteria bacterium]|nr:M50 family metallopeptidase [Candidatus Melainabacteria bacterium]